MNRFLFLVLLIGVFGCKNPKALDEDSVQSKSKLIEVFRASSSSYPNISVHRGGKGLKNYPENCLETLQYVSDSISAIYEVDVAQTKDGKLILMHDNSIDRTTTGTGLVKDRTYAELKNYSLIDDYGNQTNYKIPLFSEVLKWCRENEVILTVDIKRSVKQEKVLQAIRASKAKDICIVITYDVEQAKSAYRLAPELLLSVAARNHEEFERLLKSKIPMENLLAFTGTRLSDDTLYKSLHDENILCILGTLGNLDGQAQSRGDQLYAQWVNKGIDIIATDRPFEAFKAIN